MKVEVYNKNNDNLRVAFFCKKTFGATLLEHENLNKIAAYNNLEIHLFDTKNKNFIIFKSIEEQGVLNEDEHILKIYDHILDYLKKNKIKICVFFGSGFPWTKTFLEKVKKNSYIACYFGDDPEGAGYTSKHYVKNYHYAFCGGVYFDSKKRTTEKYIEWGARKSKFIPLGVSPVKYREPVNVGLRDVDIVYVGGAYLKKILRIFKLKKHFGNRMKIYGKGWNYNGKNIIKIIIARTIKSFYNILEIDELPNDQLIDLYQKSKIGFNIHMSYGPSNLRMYELPMNGVLQICDCENGLKELFEINREVITYKNINEAIGKIEYYLKNDGERKKIAQAGYERVKNNYRLEQSFKLLIDEIRSDVAENFNGLYEL